jgi:hypothetical protein
LTTENLFRVRYSTVWFSRIQADIFNHHSIQMFTRIRSAFRTVDWPRGAISGPFVRKGPFIGFLTFSVFVASRFDSLTFKSTHSPADQQIGRVAAEKAKGTISDRNVRSTIAALVGQPFQCLNARAPARHRSRDKPSKPEPPIVFQSNGSPKMNADFFNEPAVSAEALSPIDCTRSWMTESHLASDRPKISSEQGVESFP